MSVRVCAGAHVNVSGCHYARAAGGESRYWDISEMISQLSACEV